MTARRGLADALRGLGELKGSLKESPLTLTAALLHTSITHLNTISESVARIMHIFSIS